MTKQNRILYLEKKRVLALVFIFLFIFFDIFTLSKGAGEGPSEGTLLLFIHSDDWSEYDFSYVGSGFGLETGWYIKSVPGEYLFLSLNGVLFRK